jgi:hypothetical protein
LAQGSFLDLKAGSESPEVNVALQRGATVTGSVVGPDGQLVHDAAIFSRTIVKSTFASWKVWRAENRGRAYDGNFELHGLNPDIAVPVFFLDAKHKLGATQKISGKSAAGGAVIVRLEPCGTAKARLVNPTGKPLTGFRLGPLFTRMVITPGALARVAQQKSEHLSAEEDRLSTIDPINYANPLISEADGWVTLPALITGANYRFIDLTTFREPKGPQLRKEFSVKAGETLNLGDILIEKPQVAK